MIKLSDVINKETSNNKAIFNCYRSGKLYYNVIDSVSGKIIWEFPVDVTDTNDIGCATFDAEFKLITLMRYVRKAIANDTLVSLVV